MSNIAPVPDTPVNPFAEAVALVRARDRGDDATHGEIMEPYIGDADRLLALFTYLEQFTRVMVRELAKLRGISADELLDYFAKGAAAEIPPDLNI